MVYGEAYKLMADGPYCDIFYINGTVKTETKTLKKLLEKAPEVCLRMNRKVAVRKTCIVEMTVDRVVLNNNEVFEFSRRRKPILK